MIRQLKGGTFPSRRAAEKHERAVQYFKRAGRVWGATARGPRPQK
jgi:hypothetical protein